MSSRLSLARYVPFPPKGQDMSDHAWSPIPPPGKTWWTSHSSLQWFGPSTRCYAPFRAVVCGFVSARSSVACSGDWEYAWRRFDELKRFYTACIGDTGEFHQRLEGFLVLS